MYKKKRAQVTIYIILGIIILFLAVLLFYFRGKTTKEMSMQELVSAQKIPRDIRPITNYVTINLDDAAKKGLLLIGMQGGYIYEYQGGPVPDCNCSKSKKAIYHNGYWVYYDIHKDERDYYNYWFYKPKRYPWIIYPYYNFAGIDVNKDFEGIGGHFGISELPPLDGPSPVSMESQLTVYITNYLKKNIDLTIFNELGFEIDEDKIDVSVIIGKDDVTIFLEYPLIINKTLTNKITKVNYFYTNPQVRLKKIHEFADEIINKDITDILFDIGSSDNDKEYIKVEGIIRDAYENDDIAVIKDEKSMLYAEPYTFQFSRENRYPALRYIPLTKLTFFGTQSIMNAEITEDRISLKADDPDEDGVSFEIEPGLPYKVTDADLDKGYVILTVYANEEGSSNQDWQEVRIDLIGES